MESFATIYQRACDRKGGSEALEALLPEVLSADALRAIPDDRYLAQMAKSIFQSGFVWRVVENKWPAFEDVFSDFNPVGVANFSDEKIDKIAQDTRIIRHYKKVQAVRDNASMILAFQSEYGSFSACIADWPESDIIGLWWKLKKEGSRLGGNTGPYVLRQMGKATFILSNDVCHYLVSHNIVEQPPKSKRDLVQVQKFFNDLREKSGWNCARLSRLIAMSVGDNV